MLSCGYDTLTDEDIAYLGSGLDNWLNTAG